MRSDDNYALNSGIRDGSVGKLLAGLTVFDFWQGKVFFFYFTVLKSALESTQPPIQWLLGSHSCLCTASNNNSGPILPFGAYSPMKDFVSVEQFSWV
jgi:hypothetical protein